jgi:hypothetical protein
MQEPVWDAHPGANVGGVGTVAVQVRLHVPVPGHVLFTNQALKHVNIYRKESGSIMKITRSMGSPYKQSKM